MRNFIVWFSISILFGCASTQPSFTVSVDSLASPTADSHKTYILIPGNEGILETDLQFKEYESYLVRVLNSQGYTPANSGDEADLAIILSYGIGEPQSHKYSYSLPTWGQTGVSSSNTYGTATTYGNTTSVNTSTTYTPTYGVTGSTNHTGTSITYHRYALITGYDYAKFKQTKAEIQLWKTTISSVGSSGDLRRVFPVLIAASAPYLGTNTGQIIPVSIKESDSAVITVKGLTKQ
ncbi:hypothetical protein QO198_20120 [Pseudoalteromonas distincta]|uniref:hypothetical protein n=1 Tax=Pseudoalteromonas distincta TaxID=77608 RepID=UPI00352FC5BA